MAVPAWLVKAVIQQESGFNPQAMRREPDGRVSRGLMQVLDDTARALGVANPETAMFDPVKSIDAGVHYLAQLLQRYKGDVVRAVAAYNKGPGNVPRTGPFSPTAYASAVLAIGRYFGGQLATVGGGAAALALVAAAAVLLLRRRASR